MTKHVCVIGCGHIAKSHAKYLKGKVKLSAYSRTGESAARFQKQFDAHHIYGSLQAVYADTSVDAVLITSPPDAHKDQIICAIKNKKHVLVEKPFICSAQELLEVETCMSQHPESWLMVAENYHYKPSLDAIKNLIIDGKIGKLEKIFIRKMFSQDSQGWKSKYGALFEGGVHFVALISSLMDGKSPLDVKADFPSKHEPERTVGLQIDYHGGVKVRLDYSWETQDWLFGAFQHSHVVGDKGVITFESNGLYVQGPHGFLIKGLNDLSGRKAMLDDFMQCLEDQTCMPKYGFKHAARDMKIVFDAYSVGGRPIMGNKR